MFNGLKMLRFRGAAETSPRLADHGNNGEPAMLKWFLRRQIAAFERTWNYDASYIREMIDADPRAVML